MEDRPILHEVLDEVGLVAVCQAERVARNKIVEELLDVLCSRGFLNMSDLRDAIARNRLKMDDLTGPREFILGDPLIRANRKLALRLDGVYRRGEIYLRLAARKFPGFRHGDGPVPHDVCDFAVRRSVRAAQACAQHFIEAITGFVYFAARHIVSKHIVSKRSNRLRR